MKNHFKMLRLGKKLRICSGGFQMIRFWKVMDASHLVNTTKNYGDQNLRGGFQEDVDLAGEESVINGATRSFTSRLVS